MPQPPILPPINWPEVFNSGKTYADWLATPDDPSHVEKIMGFAARVRITELETAWLKALPREVHVLAIAETWCGDVMRHIPVLAALAERAPRLQLRCTSRAAHPDVFARFLTNGGEAIPKFVFLSDKFTECGNWGPMPEACRRLISRGKGLGDVGLARQRVSALYDADPNLREVTRELIDLIDIASSTAL